MPVSRIALLVLATAVAFPCTTPAAEDIPVLSGIPACRHDKLGSVEVTEGSEPTGATRERNMPAADYGRAFRRLGDEAARRGANAVAVFGHEAKFFTQGRARSTRPVHVRLDGAAIRIHDPAGCTLARLDASTLQGRAMTGKAQKIIGEAGPPSAAAH